MDTGSSWGSPYFQLIRHVKGKQDTSHEVPGTFRYHPSFDTQVPAEVRGQRAGAALPAPGL